MKKIYPLIFILLLFFSACNEWVTDLEPTNDLVLEDDMNKQANINFMVIGLHNRLSGNQQVWLTADGMSDQLYFDLKINGATYPSYQEIDINNTMNDQNGETTSSHNWIQLMRMNADTLVWRCLEKIQFTNDAAGTAAKNEGLFWGYFYGGFARYQLAAFIGTGKTTGGSVINGGPVIPANTMFDNAAAKYKEALKYTTDAYRIKLVNSMLGKLYLMKGDYATALTHLNLGLVKNDKAFTANYNIQGDNLYRTQAGEIRQQWAVDNRFKDYVTANPDEAKRIKFKSITYKGFTYLQQTMYVQDPLTQAISSIPVMDWQETALMKAELAVRGIAGAGDARTLINDIRTSRGFSAANLVPATTTIDLNFIYTERDKELFLRGNRLLDQRRFNKPHISDMWLYMPIPYAEKLRNPNLK